MQLVTPTKYRRFSSILTAFTATSFLISIFLTHTLWDRINRSLPSCPLIPIQEHFLGQWLFSVLTIGLVISLIFCFWPQYRRWGIGISIFLWIVFVILDVNCFQPSFYFFSVVLLLIWFKEYHVLNESQLLGVIKYSIAALYTYSGLHKFNAYYYDSIYVWMAQTYTNQLPDGILKMAVLGFGHYTPYIETAIGIGLLFSASQEWANIGAIFLHLFILYALGPLGHQFNSVIFPWNLLLILLHIQLYLRNDYKTHLKKTKNGDKHVLYFSIVFWLVPAFGFFGWADMYVTHDLYSGRAYFGFIKVPNQALLRLSYSIRSRFQPYDSSNSYCSLTDWAMNELGVPLYPERRVTVYYKEWFEGSISPQPVTLIISRMQENETIE